MKKLIEGFSTQLRTALEIASQSKFSPSDKSFTNIVIAGMGGSGIGGNLVQAMTMDITSVPLYISKSYDLPSFVSSSTLFLACSYSGGTEETIATTLAANAKGATIVCVSSGGKVGELAKEHGWDIVHIPGHDNSPRASIGYAYVQILNILNAFGLTSSNLAAEVAKAADLLDSENDAVHSAAVAIAKDMKEKFVILYSDSRLESVVIRTQQQIAENSKQLAHCNVMPEMNHNELVGWAFPKFLWEKTYTLMLRSGYDNPRTSKRMDISKDIFSKIAGQVVELHAKGDSFAEQAIYLIYLLDWVSFYLAEENGVDPFPVDVITFLKTELAKY
jgi:glucose/mannose-6-phosphate isomerase